MSPVHKHLPATCLMLCYYWLRILYQTFSFIKIIRMMKQVYLDLHLKQVYLMFQAASIGRRVGEGLWFIWFCGDYPVQHYLRWSRLEPGETEVARFDFINCLDVCLLAANGMILSVVARWKTNQFMPDICVSTFVQYHSTVQCIRYASDTKNLGSVFTFRWTIGIPNSKLKQIKMIIFVLKSCLVTRSWH